MRPVYVRSQGIEQVCLVLWLVFGMGMQVTWTAELTNDKGKSTNKVMVGSYIAATKEKRQVLPQFPLILYYRVCIGVVCWGSWAERNRK
jgi:hypothetical protein